MHEITLTVQYNEKGSDTWTFKDEDPTKLMNKAKATAKKEVKKAQDVHKQIKAGKQVKYTPVAIFLGKSMIWRMR